MSKGKKHQKFEYLNNLQEWQDHQYDPGHYTGGKTPYFITKPGRPKLLGWTFIFSGLIIGTVIFLMIIKSFDLKQLPAIIMVSILCEGINAIQVIAGIRILRKLPAKQLKRDIN